MAKVNTDKFLDLLKRCGLLDDEQIAKALLELRSELGDPLPDDADRVAEALIQRDLLTRWQANNLLDGKHKGFMLGKYKLLKHLGTGGMSSVYLGEHLAMHHRVAIKVLPRSKVEDSSYLARFQLEARAAAALNHRNIVRAFDIDHDGRTHYLIMEYIEGADLHALVKEGGPLDYPAAADYVAQAAEGLQHAHDSGLIHRDIKPANLLLDGKGTVKILDMGLAKFSDSTLPSLTIAHDENVLGTADYLAPEQAINSHGVDHRADIYSLGCTLYFLLTGHPPFCEGTLPQRLMKHQTEQPPSIYEDRSDAPQALVDICSRMMVKTPEGRYSNAQDIAADLRAWLADPSQIGPPQRATQFAAAQMSENKAASSSDVRRKELRTRKSSPPPARRPSTPGGDTLSASDSDTFKGRPSVESELPTIEIRADESDRRSVTSGGSARGRGSESGSDKRPAGSDKQRAAAARARSSLGDSSGEFVFNPEVFDLPATSAAGANSSKRNNPSIMEARSDRRQAKSDRRQSKRSESDTPYWIWIMLAVGVLIVLGLMFAVLNR